MGNIVSGLLTEFVSWRAVLLINLPIGLLVAAAALWAITNRHRHTGSGIDVVGAALATTGLFAVTYSVSRIGNASTLIAAVLGAAAVVAFSIQQRNSKFPVVPLSLLANRTVLIGNALMLVIGACFQVPVWLFLTYLMQRDLGYSPLQGTGVAEFTAITPCS